MTDTDALVEDLLAGEQRALGRAISRIENRTPGYRDLVGQLYPHAGDAHVVGVTGAPGAGKSTLVDTLAAAYRDAGHDVGVVAVDPASPYSGGAVLGDRVRMGATRGERGIFVRSMSARGHLGGLSTATTDAIVALDAAGKDRILVETVGAGQNEIEIVRTADTVAVLVTPAGGDAVQTLKAGILEIADVFVVNKADLDGVDRTVADLREMVEAREGGDWTPPIVETVATDGTGIEALRDALEAHAVHLDETGQRSTRRRDRHAAQLQRLLREDAAALAEDELAAHGGIDALVDRLQDGENPYELADEVLETVRSGGEP
jgi:LAO/AO transport system kinase